MHIKYFFVKIVWDLQDFILCFTPLHFDQHTILKNNIVTQEFFVKYNWGPVQSDIILGDSQLCH